MPSGAEVLGNGAIRRQKTLGMPGRFEPLHAILTLPRGAMRVLTAVVQIATLAMFHPRQDLPLGRAVALQLIRDDDPRYIPQTLEQLAKKLLRRLLIAPALHQNIEDVVILIDGAPQVMAFTRNRQKHFVQVPFVAWLSASTLQLIRVVLPKFQTPLADGFMGDVDPALEQDLLHIAVAQGEAVVEPDAMANDLTGEAVVFVACGVSGWRHGWLPIGVCAWFVRGHHRSEYLMGQAVGSTT